MAASAVPVDHSAAAAPPSAFTGKLQHSSPLDTLVRRTSSRRVKQAPVGSDRYHQPAPEPQEDPWLYESPRTPPRLMLQQGQYAQHLSPSSPLLHGHFTRDSTATASSDNNNSYLDPARSSVDSRNVYQDSELEYRYYDSDSVYSEAGLSSPALRDSWRSAATTETARPPAHHLSHDIPPPSPSVYSYMAPPSPVPMVVVSSPAVDVDAQRGRAPVVRSITSNYSRPVRAAPPPPPSDLEEQKRRVLERNATRRNLSSRPSLYSSQSEMYSSQLSVPSGSRSVSASRAPPSGRTGSPVSLYSNYSYYPYDSAAPSPVNSEFQQHVPRQEPPVTIPDRALPIQAPPKGRVTEATASTPQDYLQLGIQHHEANRLKESAVYFEKSAREDGGCGVGKLMWGLALRHGWGCEKNEKTGFKWLRNAAESAVGDLEAARRGEDVDRSAVQTELVLAIYEVGQCFFHGWGVPKDQKMGMSYYTVAARLGDADAQSDLAFCLANGKGCKKDRKEAAKWYRAAVGQGQSDIGLAWIYKEKYQ